MFAIPVLEASEVMRPLPAEKIPGMPPFFLGLAVIRGSPVPVIDFNLLVERKREAPILRYILLKVGNRNIALAVDGILGVRRLSDSVLHELPPLLQDTDTELIKSVSVKDEKLFFVLRTARIVPDEFWKLLEQ
jgi:purine-binding chemotaxis protein CheW